MTAKSLSPQICVIFWFLRQQFTLLRIWFYRPSGSFSQANSWIECRSHNLYLNWLKVDPTTQDLVKTDSGNKVVENLSSLFKVNKEKKLSKQV